MGEVAYLEMLIVCTQIYRVLGTVVHLAMSADSSCRGLRSARNGPVVMELTQGLSLRYLPTALAGKVMRSSVHLFVSTLSFEPTDI